MLKSVTESLFYKIAAEVILDILSSSISSSETMCSEPTPCKRRYYPTWRTILSETTCLWDKLQYW